MVKSKDDLKHLKCSPRDARPASRHRPRNSPTTASNSVKVVIRVRPLNRKELCQNSRTVIKIQDDNVVVFDPKESDEPFFYHGVQQQRCNVLKKANKNLEFAYDRVFDHDADNSDVFEGSVRDLISSLMNGHNCSVFAYGATGAGKTFTMLGHDQSPGITILTMNELFTRIEQLNEQRDFDLGITYLEVYNETVKDLLNPGVSLHLREDGKFGVCISGIKMHRIMNAKELFVLLAKGNANRTQHPTDANSESSRSHAVFQVYINIKYRNTGERRFAKLSMIDLAGSERASATGCKGLRFKEGANINRSLLALGNCINSLADGQRYVPYRDSKLTRLLKDSIGGNCHTIMLANISPSSLHYEDTYNTLKYALRAKKIKSNTKENVVNNDLSIPQYVKLVEELRSEIESWKNKYYQLESELQAELAVWKNRCHAMESKAKEDDETNEANEDESEDHEEAKQLKRKIDANKDDNVKKRKVQSLRSVTWQDEDADKDAFEVDTVQSQDSGVDSTSSCTKVIEKQLIAAQLRVLLEDIQKHTPLKKSRSTPELDKCDDEEAAATKPDSTRTLDDTVVLSEPLDRTFSLKARPAAGPARKPLKSILKTAKMRADNVLPKVYFKSKVHGSALSLRNHCKENFDTQMSSKCLTKVGRAQRFPLRQNTNVQKK